MRYILTRRPGWRNSVRQQYSVRHRARPRQLPAAARRNGRDGRTGRVGGPDEATIASHGLCSHKADNSGRKWSVIRLGGECGRDWSFHRTGHSAYIGRLIAGESQWAVGGGGYGAVSRRAAGRGGGAVSRRAGWTWRRGRQQAAGLDAAAGSQPAGRFAAGSARVSSVYRAAVCAAMLAQLNSAMTLRRPSSPMAAARAGSLTRDEMASASKT
jgi:hypothetical protein